MDAVLERPLARRAESQLGLVTRRQLLAIGLSERQVDERVRQCRLRPLHRGVYLVGGAPVTNAVRLRAATLATGGVLSHRSAAHLLGLVDKAPPRPEITVGVTHSMRSRLVLHRSADLARCDTVHVEGVPTTNATRTLIDVGAAVRRELLDAAFERALAAKLTTFDRVLRRFFELARHGRPGIGALRVVLVDRDPTLAPAESDLETLLFKILREADVPLPVRQHTVVVGGESFRLDAAYPELLLFLEGDGFGVHSQRRTFERDRARQNLLVLAGWVRLRFTWRRLCRTPEAVVAEVNAARALRQRSRSFSLPPT